jgi:hypothetical protein
MDAILVVIYSFTKFGHFIPTLSKATAWDLANLFVTHVWKLHGLPVKTVSDRGTTFTGVLNVFEVALTRSHRRHGRLGHTK